MSGSCSFVLLHGVQSTRATWWRAAADLASLGHRVRALDLAGAGTRVDAQPGPLDVARLADGVVDDLGTDPVDVLVGHSLGAVVGLTLAAARPSLVRALILEDPPALGPDVDPADVAANVQREVERAGREPAAMAAEMAAANPAWSPLDVRHSVDGIRAHDAERTAGMLRRARWDVPGLVAACPVPVAVLAATREPALRDPGRAALPAHR